MIIILEKARYKEKAPCRTEAIIFDPYQYRGTGSVLQLGSGYLHNRISFCPRLSRGGGIVALFELRLPEGGTTRGADLYFERLLPTTMTLAAFFWPRAAREFAHIVAATRAMGEDEQARGMSSRRPRFSAANCQVQLASDRERHRLAIWACLVQHVVPDISRGLSRLIIS